MKVLFIGPSLPDAAARCGDGIDVRPPAIHGDVLAAVRAGATAIGIVDGGFEHVAPVWHKEILHALSEGIPVFGAASMGALRAAECSAFGMVGIGQIYEDYASGRRIDDADVALLYGPTELGYPALSLPLVNVEATLDRLEASGTIGLPLAGRLRGAAHSLFYKNRTWQTIVSAAGHQGERKDLLQLLNASTVDQKREDALALVRKLAAPQLEILAKPDDWAFRATSLWRIAAKQPETG